MIACLFLAACLGTGPTGDGPGLTGDPPPPRPPGVVAPSIVTSSLPVATTGQPYLTTILASGGTTPMNWLVSSGSLPPGLALDRPNGVISGTPTQAGSYTFDVNLATSIGAVARTFTLVVQ